MCFSEESAYGQQPPRPYPDYGRHIDAMDTMAARNAMMTPHPAVNNMPVSNFSLAKDPIAPSTEFSKFIFKTDHLRFLTLTPTDSKSREIC